MKNFFKRDEEIEELETEEELQLIDLDDTAGWTALEVAEEMAKRNASKMMEEIGDELAIIDVVDDDTDMGVVSPQSHTYLEEINREETGIEENTGKEQITLEEDPEPEIEYLSKEAHHLEELSDDDVEYLSMEEDEELEEEEDEEEESTPFAFFAAIADFFGQFSTMDKIVAGMGVVVLAVAIVTISAFTVSRGHQKQVTALAPVGERLELIGVTGQDTLLAVADARKAMLEASKLEEELNQTYEENELSKEVKVVMKLTSVQKDLKIKFVNQKSGKLVGNVPFEVKITDGSGKTYNKIDEDKDGIIYLTKLEPGNYTVAMVKLDDLEGYSYSTAEEKIKVKENIDYQKIDVSAEIKDQSQVDVAKEDTAAKLETEATLTDTVEWVASDKKETSSEVKYVAVDKGSIADPSLGARAILTRSFFLTSETQSGNNVVPADSVSLNQTSLSLKVGETGTLTASISPETTTDKTLTWSSDNEEVASVSQGTVTAKKAGTATITVKTVNDKTATCSVTVSEATIAVTEIKLDKTEVNLKTGESATLTATVSPDNATDKTVTWSTGDSKIATVENGKVTAVAVGTTTITAKAGEKTATCTVKVTAAETSLTLDKTTASLKTGESLTLKATVTPEGKTITWTSSDANKATVDANGKVTAKAEGEVTITASADGKQATCKVTISKAYDPKTDTTKSLKDKSGNQLYVLVNNQYIEAKVADYYKYSTFYKKETTSQYTYTGWQNLDGKTYFFDKNGNKVTGEQVIQGAKYNFNSDGSLNTGSGILGIDVSTWNGNIDWQKVKNSGVSYAIIRTGFRGSTQGALVEDNKFRKNIQGAINAGIKVGVYFFTQAVNEVEAVEEASMVLSQIQGYKISYPVFLDVESSGGRGDAIDAGTRTKVINAFCQTIRNGGYSAGVYANKTWLAQKMNVSALSGYKIWLAQYNTQVTYGGRYDMWQYSSKGTVNGISGHVDMNLSYMGY